MTVSQTQKFGNDLKLPEATVSGAIKNPLDGG
jgi:hypothetical protein